jgi:hypothetical protein
MDIAIKHGIEAISFKSVFGAVAILKCIAIDSKVETIMDAFVLSSAIRKTYRQRTAMKSGIYTTIERVKFPSCIGRSISPLHRHDSPSRLRLNLE